MGLNVVEEVPSPKSQLVETAAVEVLLNGIPVFIQAVDGIVKEVWELPITIALGTLIVSLQPFTLVTISCSVYVPEVL
jgi:hypothetical protein